VNTCNCEHTESCDVVDQLSDAKKEIETLNEQCSVLPMWVMKEEMKSELTTAKVEIEQLKITHINQADVINRHYADLTAAKEEIKELKLEFIASESVKYHPEYTDAQGFKDRLDEANLEIARINQVAEEELDEANGKIEKLRDVVERVIKIERQRSETTSLLLIAEASLPKL